MVIAYFLSVFMHLLCVFVKIFPWKIGACGCLSFYISPYLILCLITNRFKLFPLFFYSLLS